MPYSAKDLFKRPREVFHVRDLNLQDAEDIDVISWAKQHNVEHYECLFGQASVEMCKDAVKKIIGEVPQDQISQLLR